MENVLSTIQTQNADKTNKKKLNELIRINSMKNEITVSGRELHEYLELKTEYAKWFSRMTAYGFVKNVDYRIIVKNDEKTKKGRPAVDHEIKLNMAKEISMIQCNEKGKKARQYFLKIERYWNSPEIIMKRALELAVIQIEELEIDNSYTRTQVEELKTENSYAENQIKQLNTENNYAELILKNKNVVAISQIAKDYGMSGQAMNELLKKLKVQYHIEKQWLLYSKYHAEGYTHSETLTINHSDGSNEAVMVTKWTQKGRMFIYDLLKKEGILPLIERLENDFEVIN